MTLLAQASVLLTFFLFSLTPPAESHPGYAISGKENECFCFMKLNIEGKTEEAFKKCYRQFIDEIKSSYASGAEYKQTKPAPRPSGGSGGWNPQVKEPVSEIAKCRYHQWIIQKWLSSERAEKIILCAAEELNWTNEDGKVDKEAAIASVDDYNGDETLKEVLKDFVRECLEESQNEISLTKAVSCFGKKKSEYCLSHMDSEVELLKTSQKLRMPLKEDQCASVTIPKEVPDTIQDCIQKEIGSKGTKPMLSVRKSLKRIDRILSRMPTDKVISVMECTDKALGIIDSNNVLQVDKLADFVGNFEGWTNIPEARDALVEAIKSCDTSEQTDFIQQYKSFVSCLAPKFSKICSLNGELGELLLSDDFDESEEDSSEEFAEMRQVAHFERMRSQRRGHKGHRHGSSESSSESDSSSEEEMTTPPPPPPPPTEDPEITVAPKI